MPTPKDACPNCGNSKLSTSRLCKACRYEVRYSEAQRTKSSQSFGRIPDLSSLEPQWAAQFCGFFMGEGCIIIARRRHHKYGHWVYRPEMHINLRVDDRLVCEDIAAHLGGRVREYANRSSTNSQRQARWSIEGANHVRAVLELLKTDTTLPARKMHDVDLVLEYIQWRMSYKYLLDDQGRAISQDYYDRLQAIRLFKGDQVISA